MIYPWSVIELSFARELFLDYINGSENFEGKVLEIQSLSNVADQTEVRHFLDRYTDRSKYSKYDSYQMFLKNLGQNKINTQKTLASLVTLTPMRTTTPEPIINDEFKDAVSGMAKTGLEKKMLTKFLGTIEQATSCLVTTDPQFQFLPIIDMGTWNKIWSFLFMGELLSGDTSGAAVITGGYWFTIDPKTGKYQRGNGGDNSLTKYIMIRSIDLDDYYEEVQRVLDGFQFSLDCGITKDNIL